MNVCSIERKTFPMCLHCLHAKLYNTIAALKRAYDVDDDELLPLLLRNLQRAFFVDD